MDKVFRKQKASKDLVNQITIGLVIATLTGLFFVASHSYEVNFLKYVGVPSSLAAQLAELDMTVYLMLLPTVGLYIFLLLLLANYELTSKRFHNLIRSKSLRTSLLIVSAVALVATIFLPVEGIWLKVSSTTFFFGLLAFICLAFPILVDLVRHFHFRDEKLSSVALLMVGIAIASWGFFPMIMDNFAKNRAASFKSDTVLVHSNEYELIRYYNSKVLLKKDGDFFVISTDEAGLIERKNL